MSDPEELGGDPACWAHLFDLAGIDDVGGAVWSLPHGGELDANLVRLAPGGRIGEHVNEAVDVLLVVREGTGELTVDGIRHPLSGSSVALLPRRSSRSIRAGESGLAYLTIHRSRGALTIKSVGV